MRFAYLDFWSGSEAELQGISHTSPAKQGARTSEVSAFAMDRSALQIAADMVANGYASWSALVR
jgi:hypothetical protein